MEGLQKQLAEMETARTEILKKMNELSAPVARKDIEDLRKELTELIHTRTPPQTFYTGQGLGMTDLSVHDVKPLGMDVNISTRPPRPIAVLPSWDELPDSK